MQKEKEAAKFLKPMWFDLLPFKAALQKFVKVNAERRSELRTALVSQESLLKECFKDENNELSFKKIVDINEFKQKFKEVSISVNPEINEDLASILLCFGNINVEKCWGDRVPPETPDENKARANLTDREIKLKEIYAQREKDLKSKK